MPRIPKYLFINLAILLVSLATSSAGKCIVCMYDGRAYDSSNAASKASGLCYGSKYDMGNGCTGSDWSTGVKDHIHGGQKTFCRFWCPNTLTRCAGHTVNDVNNPDNMVETLIGKAVLNCHEWPTS